jgi:hypothetical protein
VDFCERLERIALHDPMDPESQQQQLDGQTLGVEGLDVRCQVSSAAMTGSRALRIRTPAR